MGARPRGGLGGDAQREGQRGAAQSDGDGPGVTRACGHGETFSVVGGSGEEGRGGVEEEKKREEEKARRGEVPVRQGRQALPR
ncbi:hypothetical protein GCM10010253_45250 [Streptomyces badius]|uniref:Uncharacterized protein n=1 Tax=Streptomyces badius TaxID=1941 RepID=A0ABQ2TEP5_STRBA|nr:hypothetical protein GCM10010253_45250 [Streptomyces badius]